MKYWYAIVPFLAASSLAFGQVEKQVDLPQDQGKLHLSVVGKTDDVQFQRLVNWFHNDLADLRQQVHYHEITTDQAAYRERYEPNISGLPTVRLQEASGVVIYEVASDELPASPWELANQLDAAAFLAKACPWRRRQPQPEPTPEPPPEQEIVPFVPPAPEPLVLWNEVLIFIGCFVGGAIGGTVAGWRKAHGG